MEAAVIAKTEEKKKRTHAASESSTKPAVARKVEAGARAGMPIFLQRAVTSAAPLLIQRQMDGEEEEKEPLQPKLRVGQQGDVYEREADRIADRVMGMPEPRVQQQSELEEPEEAELVQAKPLAAQITPLIQRQSEQEEEETEPTLQPQPEEEENLKAKGVSGQNSKVSPALGARIQSQRGGGQPLPETTRNFFEPRFGGDFSGVRVHTDAEASSAARELKAQAFTVDRDIFFGTRRYAPDSSAGKRLLAHELTHVLQQQTNNQQGQMLIQRAPLKETLKKELQDWAEKNRKSINPNNQDYAINLQEYAWTLIVNPQTFLPFPKPKRRESLKIWRQKFQKAHLLAKMILSSGKQVRDKEVRAAMILKKMAIAGFSKQVVELTQKIKKVSQVKYVYEAILDRVQSASPRSLTVITKFFIKKSGKVNNPLIDKLRDPSGSLAKKLKNTQLTAILRLLIASYQAEPFIIDLLSKVLIHKSKYRKFFSTWMWKTGKQKLLFKVLESKYFIEPDYGPTVLPGVGELKLEKDMPWVYANKQRYYVSYLVQLGKETKVKIAKPRNLRFKTLRNWLDRNTERIGEALAKKYPNTPQQWIKVYKQLTDIFFYHFDRPRAKDIEANLSGKLAKLGAGAPRRMRLKADCDVLAIYAIRYFFSIKAPTKSTFKAFEPIGYMSIVPDNPQRAGHAVALMRRSGRYYIISNKEVFKTPVVESSKNAKKEQALQATKIKALDHGYDDPEPTRYKVYYDDALANGAMTRALASTQESTRRTGMEP